MRIVFTEDSCCTRLECQAVGTNCSDMFKESLLPKPKRTPLAFLQSHIIHELALYATSSRSASGRTSEFNLGSRSAGNYGFNNIDYMPWDMAVIDAYVAFDEYDADEKAEALIDAGFKFVRGVFSNKYPGRPLLIFSGFPPEIFREAIKSFEGLSHCVGGNEGIGYKAAYEALYATHWVKHGCPDGGTISLQDAIDNYRNDYYEEEDEQL